MLASTCLAVLFVPSFFVVVQRFADWRGARRRPPGASVPAEQGSVSGPSSRHSSSCSVG
jgi:hypothetical protein